MKTSLRKWIWVLSNWLNRVYLDPIKCQMQATFPGVEFLRILLRFKKRKEDSLSYFHVLHKTWNWEVSRRIRAVDVKEMYKKAWCTCRAVVLIIKTIAFLSCCRRRGRSFLSSLLRQVSSVVGLVQLHLNQVNNWIQIVETAGKPQQFLKIEWLF